MVEILAFYFEGVIESLERSSPSSTERLQTVGASALLPLIAITGGAVVSKPAEA